MTAASVSDSAANNENARPFLAITTADLIVRSAYQMGKSPLLPIFAASLGAGDLFLGLIVSVSTLTGMVLKPFIGVFSDRWGWRVWLIAGTLLFAIMPFLYRFVHTPQELFAIRIAHGMATAIYGPVTLAFVAEQTLPTRRAGKFGLFSLARSGGYIIGPAAAGWLLMRIDAAQIFTIIGLVSCLALLPVLFLPKPQAPAGQQRPALCKQLREALRVGSKTPAVWISGGLDAAVYIALYALKAFLPVYGITLGMSVVQIGLFFSVQEAAAMILKPLGGRLGDRWGHMRVIALGMLLYGFTLPLLARAPAVLTMMILAGVFGAAQALVFPATTALVANRVDQAHLGAGMGLSGALNNAAKVIGPILGGILITQFDFAGTLQLLGLMLLLSGGVVLLGIKSAPQFLLTANHMPDDVDPADRKFFYAAETSANHVSADVEAADLSAARWQAMAKFYEEQGMLTRDNVVEVSANDAAVDAEAARWQAMAEFYEEQGLLTRDNVGEASANHAGIVYAMDPVDLKLFNAAETSPTYVAATVSRWQ